MLPNTRSETGVLFSIYSILSLVCLCAGCSSNPIKRTYPGTLRIPVSGYYENNMLCRWILEAPDYTYVSIGLINYAIMKCLGSPGGMQPWHYSSTLHVVWKR